MKSSTPSSEWSADDAGANDSVTLLSFDSGSTALTPWPPAAVSATGCLSAVQKHFCFICSKFTGY